MATAEMLANTDPLLPQGMRAEDVDLPVESHCRLGQCPAMVELAAPDGEGDAAGLPTPMQMPVWNLAPGTMERLV